MIIAVLANNDSWNELVSSNPELNWIRCENETTFLNTKEANAYFNLLHNASEMDYSTISKPVFLNSVSKTLQNMAAAHNIYRINGWNGFIKRDTWEIANIPDETASTVLTILNKKAVPVTDEPGFIAARIISMIINEAYFAKAENVSSEKEIDIAMKLGTNYPYGPFEWARLIGIKNIYELLTALSKNDPRYIPSTLLAQEAEKV